MLHKPRRVTRSAPCPVCGRPDYCLVASDGRYVVCMRTESAKPAEGGLGSWVHFLNGNTLFDVLRRISRPERRPKFPRPTGRAGIASTAASSACCPSGTITVLTWTAADLRRKMWPHAATAACRSAGDTPSRKRSTTGILTILSACRASGSVLTISGLSRARPALPFLAVIPRATCAVSVCARTIRVTEASTDGCRARASTRGPAAGCIAMSRGRSVAARPAPRHGLPKGS